MTLTLVFSFVSLKKVRSTCDEILKTVNTKDKNTTSTNEDPVAWVPIKVIKPQETEHDIVFSTNCGRETSDKHCLQTSLQNIKFCASNNAGDYAVFVLITSVDLVLL